MAPRLVDRFNCACCGRRFEPKCWPPAKRRKNGHLYYGKRCTKCQSKHQYGLEKAAQRRYVAKLVAVQAAIQRARVG